MRTHGHSIKKPHVDCLLVAFAALLMLGLGPLAAPGAGVRPAAAVVGAAATGAAAAANPASLDDLLEPIRTKHAVPGLAAAVVKGDVILAAGAVGFRKDGSPERIALEDRWQLGSCTKAMQATVIGRLVEEGKLAWDTTIAEVFPELKGEIRADTLPVTVKQRL